MLDPDFPPVDPKLIKALDDLFPERSPEVTELPSALMFRGGQRSVVRFLKAKLEAQSENIMTS